MHVKASKILAIFMICVFILIIGIGLYNIFADQEDGALSNSQSITLYFIDSTSRELKAEQRQVTVEENDRPKKTLSEVVLNNLKAGPVTPNYLPTIPEQVVILGGELEVEEEIIYVNISKEYYDLGIGEKLFFNASLVWSLTELEFIQGVCIMIEGEPLTVNGDNEWGVIMREDIRIASENSLSPEGANIQELQLYFANKEMTNLVVETRDVRVNSDDLERYILEELIKGPENAELTGIVPSDTKILSIETRDGVCYLDLSMDFVTKLPSGVTVEELAVYSIVNSLTSQVSKINKVQFLIEGKRQDFLGSNFDISAPFEAKDLS